MNRLTDIQEIWNYLELVYKHPGNISIRFQKDISSRTKGIKLFSQLTTDAHTHTWTNVNLELTPPEVGQLLTSILLKSHRFSNAILFSFVFLLSLVKGINPIHCIFPEIFFKIFSFLATQRKVKTEWELVEMVIYIYRLDCNFFIDDIFWFRVYWSSGGHLVILSQIISRCYSSVIFQKILNISHLIF